MVESKREILKVSPFRQGKTGVEETKLKDGGLESKQGSTRRHNHAFALPAQKMRKLATTHKYILLKNHTFVLPVMFGQLKRDLGELKTKHRKALLPIWGSSSARGRSTKWNCGGSKPQLLSLWENFFLFFSYFSPDGKYGKLYFAVLVNGRGAIGKFNRLTAPTQTDLNLIHTLLIHTLLNLNLKLTSTSCIHPSSFFISHLVSASGTTMTMTKTLPRLVPM